MHQTQREQSWDEKDFALFYEHYDSSVLDYLRMQTRTLEDAEDILVDVFLAVRQTPGIGQETARGQWAWLRQVARNKMVDAYRRPGQARVVPWDHAGNIVDQDTDSNPELALVQSETLEQLRAAVECLSTSQQELLRLRFAEGLRCPQIAVHMGKREGAIRTMLVRTLRTLRGIYHTSGKE